MTCKNEMYDNLIYMCNPDKYFRSIEEKINEIEDPGVIGYELSTKVIDIFECIKNLDFRRH